MFNRFTGAFQVVWILSGTFIASKFRNCRTIVMACWLIPTIIGVTLMWKIDRKEHGVGVLFGYYLVGCYVASLVLALQMPTTNLGGYTKRITASGMVFLAYCVGNIGEYSSVDATIEKTLTWLQYVPSRRITAVRLQ